MTGSEPTLGELMLGVEGLAVLRLLYADAAEARAARMAETRHLLDRLADDPPSNSTLGVEYGLQEGYARWSTTYDRPLRLFTIEEQPMRRLVDALPIGHVLDAACGTGRYASYLHSRGHSVTGVDQSPAMLDLARAKLPRSRFVTGQLTDLPLDDDSADAAVCALALVHLPDINPAMSELARVVRPGGRILISDVHPLLVVLGWQAQFPTDHGRAFMRLHSHLVSDYAAAALAAGLVIGWCEEPLLTPAAAATPTADLIPEANRDAYVGLPGVLVWAFERPS